MVCHGDAEKEFRASVAILLSFSPISGWNACDLWRKKAIRLSANGL